MPVVQSVVQVNTEVFMLLYPPMMKMQFDLFMVILKSRIISFVLSTFKMRWLFPHLATKRSTCSLYFFSHDGNAVWLNPDPPKIHSHLLCLVHIQDEMTVPTSQHKVPSVLCTQSLVHHWYAPQLQSHLSISAGDRTLTCPESLRCTEWRGMGGLQSPVLLTTCSDTQPFSLTNCGLLIR